MNLLLNLLTITFFFSISTGSNIGLESTLTRCCERGKFSISSFCEPRRKEIEPLLTHNDQYDPCSLAYRLCCVENRASGNCEKAQNNALKGQQMDYENTLEGNCYIACQLGIQTGQSTGHCDLKWADFGLLFTKSWTECCLSTVGRPRNQNCDIIVSCDGQPQPNPKNCKPCPENPVSPQPPPVNPGPPFVRPIPAPPCANDTVSCKQPDIIHLNICDGIDCGPRATCVPRPYHNDYYCEPYCALGMVLGPNKTFCVDIDECKLGIYAFLPTACSLHAVCRNVPGSFVCDCMPGYEKDENGKCVDIDECQTQDVCIHDECRNTQGSFECICRPGYRSIDGQCTDIDECIEMNPCQRNDQVCINLPGSYRCSCGNGYMFVGNTCQDIDECTNNPTICSWECENQVGSFRCRCPSGYQLSSDARTCVDVNECERHVCSSSKYCWNIHGSYLCIPFPQCHPPYNRTSQTTCQRNELGGIRVIDFEYFSMFEVNYLSHGAKHVYELEAKDCTLPMVRCDLGLVKSSSSLITHKSHFELRRKFNPMSKSVFCSVYMIKPLNANQDLTLQLNTTIFKRRDASSRSSLVPWRAYEKFLNIHVSKNPFKDNTDVNMITNVPYLN